MNELARGHCEACEGGVPPLEQHRIDALMGQLAGWATTDAGRALERRWDFEDFHQTMAFVNAVAFVAHRENHHPDLEVHYSSCVVRYTTHAAGGLTLNDFICAAKVDLLLADAG